MLFLLKTVAMSMSHAKIYLYVTLMIYAKVYENFAYEKHVIYSVIT
jgi:hypothetical protein